MNFWHFAFQLLNAYITRLDWMHPVENHISDKYNYNDIPDDRNTANSTLTRLQMVSTTDFVYSTKCHQEGRKSLCDT